MTFRIKPDIAGDSLVNSDKEKVRALLELSRSGWQDADHPTLCDRCVEAVQ